METDQGHKIKKIVTSKIKKAERDLRQLDLQKVAATYHTENSIPRLRNNIVPISTQDTVHAKEPETRPCQRGYSQIHHLKCGHFVRISTPGFCGKNCKEAKDEETNAGIHCLLCFRQDCNLDANKENARWYDLLMPSFTNLKVEEKEALEAAALERKSEPAYLGITGWIVLPRVPYEIAMIIASEKAKEREAKRAMDTFIASEGYSDEEKKRSVDFFLTFLEHAYELAHPTPMLMASYAARLSIRLKASRVRLRDDVVGRYFKISSEEDNMQHYAAARKCIIASTSADLLVLFCKKAPPRLKLAADFKKGNIRQTAWNVWRWLQKHLDITNSKDLHWLWDRRTAVVAGCIAITLREFKYKMNFFDICQVLGMDLPKEPDYSKTEDPDSARDNWESSEEGKIYIDTMRAYAQLTGMVNSKDFRSMLVRSRIQRREAHRRTELAAQGTSGADALLANFGLQHDEDVDMEV
ncbi:hypothetical protein BDV96DRAFT_642953 [Lophiotrema nucula]|uniref:Uncharacterized protein n=1 Tax=Lophiotrema nucula TaxID=690887 RepID=A0A6A5ZK13_9PLEO|nr:hypothetical protein BDV96DRAFT_642953 [Lophiotrema nucula]